VGKAESVLGAGGYSGEFHIDESSIPGVTPLTMDGLGEVMANSQGDWGGIIGMHQDQNGDCVACPKSADGTYMRENQDDLIMALMSDDDYTLANDLVTHIGSNDYKRKLYLGVFFKTNFGGAYEQSAYWEDAVDADGARLGMQDGDGTYYPDWDKLLESSDCVT
jgi:hypothetical protein